ncbi:unknown [Parabacteroides sp. CAG:409]|nr:unknown [Parabacteroides sp. CAG:409]
MRENRVRNPDFRVVFFVQGEGGLYRLPFLVAGRKAKPRSRRIILHRDDEAALFVGRPGIEQLFLHVVSINHHTCFQRLVFRLPSGPGEEHHVFYRIRIFHSCFQNLRYGEKGKTSRKQPVVDFFLLLRSPAVVDERETDGRHHLVPERQGRISLRRDQIILRDNPGKHPAAVGDLQAVIQRSSRRKYRLRQLEREIRLFRGRQPEAALVKRAKIAIGQEKGINTARIARQIQDGGAFPIRQRDFRQSRFRLVKVQMYLLLIRRKDTARKAVAAHSSLQSRAGSLRLEREIDKTPVVFGLQAIRLPGFGLEGTSAQPIF